MAAYALTRAGARVVMLEAGPEWYARRTRPCSLPDFAIAAPRARRRALRPFGEFDACDGGWEIEGEPYTRAAGHDVRLVARPHARRTHQSLGAHLAALRARRLQGEDQRRARRRLADRLRRHRAVLRPGRRAGRHLRQRRRSSQPPRRQFPSRRPSRAATSCSSRRRRDKLNITCIPSRLSIITKPHHRPTGVPLLRAVQSRLHGRTRTSRVPTCSSRRRSRPAGSRCSPTRWRAR